MQQKVRSKYNTEILKYAGTWIIKIYIGYQYVKVQPVSLISKQEHNPIQNSKQTTTNVGRNKIAS